MVTAQDRIARGEAPVKAEYIRESDIRIHVGQVHGSKTVAAPDTAVSKRQAKRDRARSRYSTSDLCSAFCKGTCKFGNECKFNHDVAAYLANKPVDLPGECPFQSVGSCPYGITCRWARSHLHPDALSKEYLQQCEPTEQRPMEQGGVDASADDKDKTSIMQTSDSKESGASQDEILNGETQSFGFWRGDGSIPTSAIPLMPPAEEVTASINHLDKAVQSQLFHRRYDFSESDAVLQSMGLRNSQASRDRPDERGGKKKRVKDAESLPGVPVPSQQPDEVSASVRAVDASAYKEAAETARERRAIDFRDKLYLAPLTTVGNLPFRRLAVRLGADVTCGEMAMATNLLQGQPSEWALLKRHPEERCFGAQLCGGYPDAMARCAELIQDQTELDFVDINFGCPIDVVCQKGAGSACLLKPGRMEQVVRSMNRVLDCPVTFKARKAYNDGQDIAHEFVPQAGSWGASAVVLHGRTREQRYSRPADWPYIQSTAAQPQSTPLQIIGNGDIMCWRDHYRHLEESDGHLATTYIARGALIKPWIFTEIKERRDWDISAGERLDLIRQFCSFGLEHWGSDTRGVEATRRFLLEWLSFQHRYIPVALLEVLPQRMDLRPPVFVGRSDLETLLASDHPADWVRISEMLLGPAPEGFTFTPKHKANAYARRQEAPTSGRDDAQENG